MVLAHSGEVAETLPKNPHPPPNDRNECVQGGCRQLLGLLTWMVTRRTPLMVPGGWLRMARWVGPPPLPTVPPRPWNSVSFTPQSSATLDRRSCAHRHMHASGDRMVTISMCWCTCTHVPSPTA